jgi:hypothetical protein
MSQKIMLLALAVASVAMFALPAAASAQEIHLEGVTSFSGTAGPNTFSAEGEATFTCESADVSGTVSAGGTTGELSYDFTGCHMTVFGITAKCRTAGSVLDNTIKSAGTFHLITISSGVPGILVTPVVTTIACAGISNTFIGGTTIGTITDSSTSLTCSRESTELVTKFTATGSGQDHKTYTGAAYNLTSQTSGGAVKNAGLVSTTTSKSATKGKLNCT